MVIRSERGIYQLVEKHLRKATSPVTCVALMDIPEVRKEAQSEFGDDIRNATNKLSDTLGFMWRRGLLTRYPAPRESLSLARYAYEWADKKAEPDKPISPPTRHLGKTQVNIQEHEEGVEIEFDKFIIYIRPK